MPKQNPPSKPYSEKTSRTSNGHKPKPESGPDMVPDGGKIDAALVEDLHVSQAQADYRPIYELICELPEAWGNLAAADRQGAVQIAWLQYYANSYRLSGQNTEYVNALALGWLDDECRVWMEGQIHEDRWRRARYEKFYNAMGRLSPTVAHPSPTENGVDTSLSPVSPAPGVDTLPEIELGEVFPVDALGKFAAAALDVHKIVKTPLSICAASVLGSLSVVVQGVHDVVLDGRVEPTSLYLLTVAPSGARKTACDTVIFREIRQFDRQQKRIYHDELREYKKRLLSRKGAGPPPEPPADPKILFTDGTGEAIQRDAHKAKFGTRALVTDEGGRFFSGWSLTAERQPAGLSVFSSLWDGGEITVRRMGEGGSYTLYDRRVMLHIQVQALVVKRFLTDPMVACQGLLGRFLVAQIDKVPAREYQRDNPFETDGMARLYAVHRLLLKDALECEDIDQGIVRKTLTLASKAIRYWSVVHDGFEKLREGAGDDALASFYGKAPAHVLRIAGTLAAAHGEREIGTDRVRDASRIVRWYAADMERAQDVASVSDADREVLAFRNWLRRRQGETLTARTIQRTSTRAVKRGGVAKVREFMARLMATGYPLKETKGGWVVGDMGD